MTRRRLGEGASYDALILSAVKVMTIGLGFVITRLLSQYLSTYEYGAYSQILLIVSTASSLTILGMMDGVNYFYCSEHDAKKREAYIATMIAMQFLANAVVGSAILLFGGVIASGFGNPGLERLLVFAAILPLLQNLLNMLQVLVISVGKARMLAIRNLTVSLCRLAAVMVVIMAVRNVAVILVTTLLLDVLQIIFFLYILRRNQCLVRIRCADLKLSRRILSYCIPMAVFIVLNNLNKDCDKYLIALMTDTRTMAVYSNASKQLPFDVVMASFCTVLLPEITRLVANREKKQAAALYKKFLEIAYISTTIVCCAALTAAPQLMELLYSEKYLGGLPVFCIYILVDMIRYTNITLILCTAGKTDKLMYLSMSSFLVNIVMNVLFFRWMGVSGPALATLIVTVTLGAVMLRMNARELDAGLRDFVDVRYFTAFLAENMIVMLILVWIRRRLSQQGLHYFVILAVVGFAYCGILGLLNGKRFLHDLKNINRR